MMFRVNSNENENEKYILLKREKEIICAKFFCFEDKNQKEMKALFVKQWIEWIEWIIMKYYIIKTTVFNMLTCME